ncbi:MAG: LysM peptidoglycan-binding domain-containing protein [Betaproteobacteria bacterium]|nr:LysM peptidoglycan-binding domain-containing protein [Betaproteobacteria bacterium]
MVTRHAKSITAHCFAFFCLVFGAVAHAQAPTIPLVLKADAPERYLVVKGDTLWDIAGRYTDSPWRWPELWDMNREGVRNPHLIYPGNVILLDRKLGRLRLEGGDSLRGPGSDAGGTTAVAPGETVPAARETAARPTGGLETVKLSPRLRAEFMEKEAIASIPAEDIAPFLVRPLVIEVDGLDKAPSIVATQNNRVVLAAQDTAYVQGIGSASGGEWFIYRRGKQLVDPDTKQTLGYEANYLGSATVTRPGELATIVLNSAVREIVKGDKLIPASQVHVISYVPHSPDANFKGRVMSIYSGIGYVGEAGPPDSIIAISRGSSQGVEIGHVLALVRPGGLVPDGPAKNKRLPDERYGLAFVFRVFDRVSYALIMKTTRPVAPLDIVEAP